MRKNSVKSTRVNEEVLRALSSILRFDLKDPRVSSLTSILAVEVAPDLKTCKIWVSVLGDELQQEKTLIGLKSSCGFIRAQLAKKVNLRNTPELTFIMDHSIEYGVSMSKLISDVNEKMNLENKDGE